MTLFANRPTLLVQNRKAKALRLSQPFPVEVRNLDSLLNMTQSMSFKVHPISRVEDAFGGRMVLGSHGKSSSQNVDLSSSGNGWRGASPLINAWYLLNGVI